MGSAHLNHTDPAALCFVLAMSSPVAPGIITWNTPQHQRSFDACQTQTWFTDSDNGASALEKEFQHKLNLSPSLHQVNESLRTNLSHGSHDVTTTNTGVVTQNTQLAVCKGSIISPLLTTGATWNSPPNAGSNITRCDAFPRHSPSSRSEKPMKCSGLV